VDSNRTAVANRFSADWNGGRPLTDGRRGNHRSDGFLITTGAGFDHGTDASPLHITELAPMVFDRLLGSKS
jgi:hypothetical protein